MTLRQHVTPGSSSSTSVPRLGSLLQWAAGFGLIGGQRSAVGRRWGLLGGGALLATAGLLLLTTQRGRTMRARWGSQAGGLLGSQVGRIVGGYIGGHPIKAARLAQWLAR